jgi:hypothetical protein
MPHGATFQSFQGELARLVDIFGKNLAAYKSGGYDETRSSTPSAEVARHLVRMARRAD